MRAPSFWWRAPGWEAALLAPAAALYGAVAAHRLGRTGEHAGIPVVCVGDPTVGGAGKTPAALTIAALLAEAGERPIFLTRGYGGHLRGPVTVDPGRHAASEVGDEPLLLARAFPTVVARDRVAGARAAQAAGGSVIVMDDGFQNPSLAKDCGLLIIDGESGLGNGRVFPAGPLRAPLGSQLERCHALLAVGSGTGTQNAMGAARARGIPVFTGQIVPEEQAAAGLRTRPVLAFAGIGRPAKFFSTLEQSGIAVAARRAFPDHHPYSDGEAAFLLSEAKAWGLDLVTTEKDFVRLEGRGAVASLRQVVHALPVRLAIEPEAEFRGFLLGRLSARA